MFLTNFFFYKSTTNLKIFESHRKILYAKINDECFSTCVHFDHFTSDFGNVKYVAATFKYPLS